MNDLCNSLVYRQNYMLYFGNSHQEVERSCSREASRRRRIEHCVLLLLCFKLAFLNNYVAQNKQPLETFLRHIHMKYVVLRGGLRREIAENYSGCSLKISQTKIREVYFPYSGLGFSSL